MRVVYLLVIGSNRVDARVRSVLEQYVLAVYLGFVRLGRMACELFALLADGFHSLGLFTRITGSRQINCDATQCKRTCVHALLNVCVRLSRDYW